MGKLQSLAAEVFEAAQKFEQKPEAMNLRELCIKWGQKIQGDPEIKGAFRYSVTDKNEPIMGIYHQDNACLTFFYSQIEKEKFFVSYNDERSRQSRLKQVERNPPVKTEVLEMEPYRPKPLLSLPPRPPVHFETPMLKADFAPRSLPKTSTLAKPCDCSACRRKQLPSKQKKRK